MDRSFQEMHLQIQARCEEITKKLDQKRSVIERFVQSRQFQLSPAVAVICGEMPQSSFFVWCLETVHCLAEALLGSFYLLPFKESSPSSLFRKVCLSRKCCPSLKSKTKGRGDIAKATVEYIKEVDFGDYPDFSPAVSRLRQRTAKRLRALMPTTQVSSRFRKWRRDTEQRVTRPAKFSYNVWLFS